MLQPYYQKPVFSVIELHFVSAKCIPLQYVSGDAKVSSIVFHCFLQLTRCKTKTLSRRSRWEKNQAQPNRNITSHAMQEEIKEGWVEREISLLQPDRSPYFSSDWSWNYKSMRPFIFSCMLSSKEQAAFLSHPNLSNHYSICTCSIGS